MNLDVMFHIEKLSQLENYYNFFANVNLIRPIFNKKKMKKLSQNFTFIPKI